MHRGLCNVTLVHKSWNSWNRGVNPEKRGVIFTPRSALKKPWSRLKGPIHAQLNCTVKLRERVCALIQFSPYTMQSAHSFCSFLASILKWRTSLSGCWMTLNNELFAHASPYTCKLARAVSKLCSGFQALTEIAQLSRKQCTVAQTRSIDAQTGLRKPVCAVELCSLTERD